MKLFDALYAATAETVKEGKKPLVKKAVFRALEGAADSIEDQRIELELTIDTGMRALASGKTEVVRTLLAARLLRSELDLQSKELALIKQELETEVSL